MQRSAIGPSAAKVQDVGSGATNRSQREKLIGASRRRDIERRFNLINEEPGWAGAYQTISLLRSIYR